SSTAISIPAISSLDSLIVSSPAQKNGRRPRKGTPDRRGSTLISDTSHVARARSMRPLTGPSGSAYTWLGFGDRLTGGFRLGHSEPDSQRQPVFLAVAPGLLVPLDAFASICNSKN